MWCSIGANSGKLEESRWLIITHTNLVSTPLTNDESSWGKTNRTSKGAWTLIMAITQGRDTMARREGEIDHGVLTFWKTRDRLWKTIEIPNCHIGKNKDVILKLEVHCHSFE